MFIYTCTSVTVTVRYTNIPTLLLCLSPGEDRGPVLEVIVSRTNFISSHTSKRVRVVGLSTALANARDLADWLGIGQVRITSFTNIA